MSSEGDGALYAPCTGSNFAVFAQYSFLVRGVVSRRRGSAAASASLQVGRFEARADKAQHALATARRRSRSCGHTVDFAPSRKFRRNVIIGPLTSNTKKSCLQSSFATRTWASSPRLDPVGCSEAHARKCVRLWSSYHEALSLYTTFLG